MKLSELVKLSKSVDLTKELVEIWSPDGWVRVLNLFENGLKPVYTYYLEDKELYCTKLHEIETTTGWKRAGELNEDDFVLYDGEPKQYLGCIYRGMEVTIDIGVEHENHRFYCNGVSVHNSKGMSYKHVIACDFTSRSSKMVREDYENLCNMYVQFSRSEESLLIVHCDNLVYGDYTVQSYKSKWLQKLIRKLSS